MNDFKHLPAISAGDEQELDDLDNEYEFLPATVRNALPQLGGTYEQGLEARAVVKFFYPDFSWTWYGVEFDGEDIFFGYVVGDVPELGTFSLRELQENRGKWGLLLERDMCFKPMTLRELFAKHEPTTISRSENAGN